MKNNSKSLLLLTVPKNHVSALASVLFDLKRYSPNLTDDILVYHDGILPSDQEKINKILDVGFRNYELPDSDILTKSHTNLTHYFTPLILARFEAFNLLDEYSIIIYTDYDITVRGDLSELLTPSPSGLKVINSSLSLRDCLSEDINAFNMIQSTYSGGIFVLDYNFPHAKSIYAMFKPLVEEYAPYLVIPDIAIMLMAWNKLEYFPDMVLDEYLYCCHPNNSRFANSAKILHCYGQPKFWSGLYSEQWEENYKAWLKLGGSPCYERTLQYKIRLFARWIKKSIKATLSK